MYLQKNFLYMKEINNLSYEKISKNTEINVSTLFTLAKGDQRNTRIEVVSKLSKYFDITIDDLVYKDLSKNVPVTGTK